MRPNVILFEDSGWRNLLPLTWLRAPCELRCGRNRLLDKVRTHLAGRVFAVAVRPELQELVTTRSAVEEPDPAAPWIALNARTLVTGDVVPPSPGGAWAEDHGVVAAAFTTRDAAIEAIGAIRDTQRAGEWLATVRVEPLPPSVRLLNYPWEPALLNRDELVRQCRSGGTIEGELYVGVHVVARENVFVGPRAVVRPGVVLDAENGPIYIDEAATIQPNAVLEGPCYVGPHTIIRPLAQVREGASIGPHCRVGGEVSASILHGCCNKQHEGFLGHSYVGEWVNLGAGTITSNLKNTYGRIRVSLNGHEVDSGQQFVGAMFGDHAKTGIGTILPTGCVLGCNANVFTRGSVPKFVPSFAWLTDDGMTHFRPDRAIEIARLVMARRGATLSDAEARLMHDTADRARAVEAAGWMTTS